MEPSSMVDRQDVRARVHGMWAAVAPGWAEHADYVDARTARLADRLLDLAAPAPGDRLLELACGPGGLGMAAARRADGIEVVLSDVAAPMVAIAARRAQELANVRARVLDLEGIDEPDRSFDVLLCREGLMFAADPERAGRELHRVARPGARVAVSVWGPQECNPWLGIVLDAMSAQLGEPVPPPGVPGPFSLADAGRLAALLGAAGFEDVAVEEQPVPLRAASFDEWWSRTSTIAGPLARRLAAMPPAAAAALEATLREAVAPYACADGIELPGLALVASARRRDGQVTVSLTP
jgi:ubiquinone/menaquinone biosynthesis C-methylase UbiE